MKLFVSSTAFLIAGVFISACVTPFNLAAPLDVPERWSFSFDSRQWQLGNQAANREQAVIEYVLNGQTVHNWTEIVTSIYTAYLSAPRAAFDRFKFYSTRDCPSLRISIIEESPDTIIFEWQHDGCQGYPAQHEIRRFSRGRTGMLSLSFVEKTRLLSSEKRNTWLNIIKSASVKPDV